MSLRLSLLALLSGCLEPSPVPCGDIACPIDSVCLAERGVCASQAALDICAGAADDTLCTAPGIDGACDHGLCVPTICGDGTPNGREQCDGALDKALHSCADFRFYYGELSCSSSCLIDTNGCSGFCGDGLVQNDQGEDCDGSQPAQSCVDLGHDYGHIHCGTACKDTSRIDCGSYRMRVILSASDPTDINDVFRDTNLLVVARTSDLLVFDRGVRYQFPGAYKKIASRGSTIELASTTGVERLDGHTLTAEPPPPISPIGLAFAPTGELWAIDESCKIAVLANGQWSARPDAFPTGGSACSDLAIDASGDVYAAAFDRLSYFNGTTWKATSLYGTRHFGESDRGTVLVGTNTGVFELDRGTPIATPVTETTFDVVQLGESYFLTGIAAGGGAPHRPVLYDPQTLDVQNARRMPDGSVIAWSRAIFELDPLLQGETRPYPVARFIKAHGGGFAYYANDVVTEYQDARRTFGVQASVTDIAMDGEYVYAVDGASLWSGKIGTTKVVEAVDAIALWVGDNDMMGVVSSTGVVSLRKKGDPTWKPLPTNGACQPRWIAGPSETELYAITNCATATIDRWDGAAWTTVFTFGGYFSRPEILDDESIAIPVNTGVIVGRGTTWKQLAVTASVVSGTAATDLWLGGTTTRSGLGHWDGRDLAEVANPDGQGFAVANITADANTMLFFDNLNLRPFSRFRL